MFCRALIIAALANLASVQHVLAAAPGNEFLAALLGSLPRQGESFACFSRQYDEAQMAARPGQKVAFAKALIAAYYRQSSLAPETGAYSYQVSLAFRFRDRRDTLTGVAECGEGRVRDSLRGGAYCAGPGDPGAHLGLQGRRVLVLTIPNGADLWAPGPLERRHDTVKNPFGVDDKTFLLVRTELSECEDLAFDRWKPLRPHEP
jgi:hypothetical protein